MPWRWRAILRADASKLQQAGIWQDDGRVRYSQGLSRQLRQDHGFLRRSNGPAGQEQSCSMSNERKLCKMKTFQLQSMLSIKGLRARILVLHAWPWYSTWAVRDRQSCMQKSCCRLRNTSSNMTNNIQFLSEDTLYSMLGTSFTTAQLVQVLLHQWHTTSSGSSRLSRVHPFSKLAIKGHVFSKHCYIDFPETEMLYSPVYNQW